MFKQPSPKDKQFKLSLSKDDLIMNHDKSSTTILLDSLMHFTFFENPFHNIYSFEIQFINKEKLDSFDTNPKKYNYTFGFVHNFYKVFNQNPTFISLHQESKTFFSNIHHPNLIMINLHGDGKTILHCINLNHLTGFDIFVDHNKSCLFKVNLDKYFDAETLPLKLETYIVLYIGNSQIHVPTQDLIKTLANIQNPTQKVLDIFEFIKKSLVNNIPVLE